MDYNCIELHLQHHLQHKSPHFRISSLVLLLIAIPTLAADDFPRIDPLGKQIFTYDVDDDVSRKFVEAWSPLYWLHSQAHLEKSADKIFCNRSRLKMTMENARYAFQAVKDDGVAVRGGEPKKMLWKIFSINLWNFEIFKILSIKISATFQIKILNLSNIFVQIPALNRISFTLDNDVLAAIQFALKRALRKHYQCQWHIGALTHFESENVLERANGQKDFSDNGPWPAPISVEAFAVVTAWSF